MDYKFIKIRADQHKILTEYAQNCKPRTTLQNALEEIIHLGLTMKRLMPKKHNGTTKTEQVES